MFTPTEDRPVGQLAAESQRNLVVFEVLGLNYHSDGQQTLRDACEQRGVDLLTVIMLLERLVTVDIGQLARHEPGVTAAATCTHITATHHAYTRTQLAEIKRLLDGLATTDTTATAELAQVRATFDRFADGLLEHLQIEETRMFPALEAAGTHELPQIPEEQIRAHLAAHAVATTQLAVVQRLAEQLSITGGTTHT